MDQGTREKLMGVSVATLATALFKRGLRNQVIQGVQPVGRKGRNMVGPAFTLRYMPAREDRNQLAEFRNPAHPQRSPSRPAPQAMCSSWTVARTPGRPARATSWSPA